MERSQIIALGAVTATSVILAAMALWKKMKESVPTKWRQIGTLQDIYIYPMKSAKNLPLTEAECTALGLKTIESDVLPLRDRFFVVYREDTKEFISARTYPKMVLIELKAVAKDKVRLSFPESEDLEIVIPQDGTAEKIKLWSETLSTFDCGDKASKWISKVVTDKEGGYRIGFWSTDLFPRRKIGYSPLYKKLKNEYLGAYSDLSSYHLLSQSSVDDLSQRIGNEANVTPKNFRPNFVIQGTQPYVEDDWDWIKIGNDAIFRNFKLCTRCTLPNVDPDTGMRDKKQEPSTTMKKYRLLKDPELRKAEGDVPIMGINIGLYAAGKVRSGDPVYVEDC